MNRPQLVNFLAIKTDDFISIRAFVAKVYRGHIRIGAPIANIRLLFTQNSFSIWLLGLDKDRNVIYKNNFNSDNFGNFNFKIEPHRDIHFLQVYECRSFPGLEIHMGTFIPLEMNSPKKLVISDFDKTLIETKYSTFKEIFIMLTHSPQYFPSLKKGLGLLTSYIKSGHHPFILSASPHFYEDSIRNWLCEHNIFTAGIFLKDYRQFLFSLSKKFLNWKDLKSQGAYKLNSLLKILLMTGIPEELVLIGDNFESDPLVYLTVAAMLENKTNPLSFWNIIKNNENFRFDKTQNLKISNQTAKLSELLAKKSFRPKVKIHIRIRKSGDEIPISIEFLQNIKTKLELFEA